ncbi:SDR family oxidoreductase [Paraburkholderia solisilvae]|uniref:Quinone oxidoreductase 2 n=1 Tax=Paraburkholderia solisilvae TaxID=624376 RepID=A0A6J5CYD4_9BURK|nr:SDR family oxidoreductase [Paraburkholderia solisilvae]CAB3746131.1 Quinone oxidoreductase 2 [Paraburkholderia solisilvae]
MSNETTILVTGASGQLGRLVIDALLKSTPATRIHALVRNAKAAASLAPLGVKTRIGDYADPRTLDAAFAGIDRLLLISSNDLGARTAQHANVIDAAKRAGVRLLAYTSLLHADTSPLGLAREHVQTETLLQASGLPFALLRNGWYTENYAATIAAAVERGVLAGSAGDGRISSAARADYAQAAAAVLSAPDEQAGRIYELAGDDSYTLAQFAAEVSAQAKKPVEYRNLTEAEYKAALIGAGLPEPVAALISDSDSGASQGGLFDDSGTLRKLIGHPTTPFASTIAATLATFKH